MFDANASIVKSILKFALFISTLSSKHCKVEDVHYISET